MSRDPVSISPLASVHRRSAFRCGETSLDDYLRRRATQDVKRRICRVFVASEHGAPATVLGYYTLSSLAIQLDELPPERARSLPHHPIPAALLGRLAVDETIQGCGVGRLLLADAYKRTLSVGEEIGIHALVVDGLNDQARAFYEAFGFIPFGADSPRLYLPLKSP